MEGAHRPDVRTCVGEVGGHGGGGQHAAVEHQAAGAVPDAVEPVARVAWVAPEGHRRLKQPVAQPAASFSPERMTLSAAPCRVTVCGVRKEAPGHRTAGLVAMLTLGSGATGAAGMITCSSTSSSKGERGACDSSSERGSGWFQFGTSGRGTAVCVTRMSAG